MQKDPIGPTAEGLSVIEMEVDPLVQAVTEYVAARERYIVECRGITDDEADALYEAVVAAPYDRLKYDTPAAMTRAGAMAALRLGYEEMQHSRGSFEKPLIAAALAFFEGRA